MTTPTDDELLAWLNQATFATKADEDACRAAILALHERHRAEVAQLRADRDLAYDKLARKGAEVEELRQYAPMCLVCGARKPCMTEADLKPGDPGTPCTFDPTPKEAAAEIRRLRAEVERLTRENNNLSAGQKHALESCWAAESALRAERKRVGELEEALEEIASNVTSLGDALDTACNALRRKRAALAGKDARGKHEATHE